MRQKLIPQRVLFFLIAAAFILLISGFVALGLGALLAALHDDLGSKVVNYLALGCGALFVIDLLCLILAMAVNSLADPDGPPDSE